MLFYALGLLFLVIGLFGYLNQDQVALGGSAERSAAAWMMGYHEVVVEACQANRLPCASPSALLNITLPPALMADVKGRFSNYVTSDGRWQGVYSVSIDNVIYTLLSPHDDPYGRASLAKGLSPGLVSAALVDASRQLPFGTDVHVGTYDQTTSSVFWNGACQDVIQFDGPSGNAGPEGGCAASYAADSTSPLSGRSVAFAGAAAGINAVDQSPVVASKVPCLGDTGFCSAPVTAASGLASVQAGGAMGVAVAMPPAQRALVGGSP